VLADRFAFARSHCFTEVTMNTTSKLVIGDMNRDPISGEPGAHPVGTGIGSAGGAAVGATVGTLLGPVGMLVGGTIGAIIGGAAGHDAAEGVDPTGEVEYWRTLYSTRPYADPHYFFESDFRPAFAFGVESRHQYSARQWDDALADHLRDEWETRRGTSTLSWSQAQPAVRDAWDRTDRTVNVFAAADRYYESRFGNAEYRDQGLTFADYRGAYRYGTYARTMHPDRLWDAELEAELARGWPLARGTSTLGWEQSRAAVHDAWNSCEPAGIAGSA
jgi:hypothetical protein